MANTYGALLGDLGILAQSQQNAGFQQSLAQYQGMSQQGNMQRLAAMQYQQYIAQQQALMQSNVYAFNAATIPDLHKHQKFVPITQEEVDYAEAWYEVDKIAPGLKEMS